MLLIIVPVAVVVGRSLWRKKTCPHALTILLDEVEKYHQVVQAIDINDQLTNSGNSQSSISDREQVISAL